MNLKVGIVATCVLLGASVAAYQGRGGGPPAGGTPVPQAVPPVEPEGAPTAAISGVVVDGISGLPVAGVIVSVDIGERSLPAGTQRRQLTDDKGRFAFANIWGGYSYVLIATKFGYLSGGVGREKSPADPPRPIMVTKDQWLGNVRVTIWRPAAVSGIVRDERGEPMVGIIVRALVRYRLMGRDDVAAGPMTLTDDRGTYRLAGLLPGRYLIQVPSVQASMPAKTMYAGPGVTNAPEGGIELDETSRLVIGRYPLPPPPVNGRPMTYPMAFHPASSSVTDAATIELKYGDDRPNIDITLSPGPALRVSGLLDGPANAMTLMTVRLLPAGLETLGQGSEAATALVDGAGQFTFVNVPPGSYTIDAPVNIYEFTQMGSGIPNRPASFPAPPGIQGWGRSTSAAESVPGLVFSTTSFRGKDVPSYSGRVSVTVGSSDLNGVVVRLKPMITMSGKIVLDPDPTQPVPATPPRFSISLDPANGEVYLGTPRNQGSPDAPPTDFSIPAVIPGQYWLRSSGGGWVVKSVVWKGRDYTAAPLDTTSGDDVTGVIVTMTNNRTTLSGIVRGTATVKPEDCMVVVFPVERAQWRGFGLAPTRFRTAPIGSGDAYSTSLPAGDYIIAAINRANRPTWLDPAVLAQLEGAGVRVSLAWGAKVTQEVPVVVIR